MKLNDKIKKLKVSYRNLIKDIQYDAKKRVVQVVLVGSLAPALVLASACTEEELLQAQHAIEQMTDNPDVIDTPDVVVEPPSVEPVVDDPVVEPEVVEPEEINPRDYAAVYDFDFEIPVYTEEEVEAAKERILSEQENMQNAYDSNNVDETLKKLHEEKDNYYKAYQEDAYKIYDSIKDININSLVKSDGFCYYYYDVSSSYIFCLQKDYLTTFGQTSDGKMIEICLDYQFSENVKVGDMVDNTAYIKIAPHAYINEYTNKDLAYFYEGFYNNYEYCLEGNPAAIISEEDFINSGYKPLNITKGENVLVK